MSFIFTLIVTIQVLTTETQEYNSIVPDVCDLDVCDLDAYGLGDSVAG